MCGGGPSAGDLRRQQTRLATIAKIKSDQKARQGQINIIGGGETEEYRRSMAEGAKDLGQTTEDIENQRLSDLFATGGEGAKRRAQALENRRKRKEVEELHRRVGSGGGGDGPGGTGVA